MQAGGALSTASFCTNVLPALCRTLPPVPAGCEGAGAVGGTGQADTPQSPGLQGAPGATPTRITTTGVSIPPPGGQLVCAPNWAGWKELPQGRGSPGSAASQRIPRFPTL